MNDPKAAAAYHPSDRFVTPRTDLDALIAKLQTNDGYVLDRHRLRAMAAAKALEEQGHLVARLTLERDSARRERRAALVGTVPRELHDQLLQQKRQVLDWLEEWGNTIAQVEGVEEAIPDLRGVFEQ